MERDRHNFIGRERERETERQSQRDREREGYICNTPPTRTKEKTPTKRSKAK